MKATKTTIPLRDRCLSHCATLGIPLEGASLDEVLSRAEKENLSHLHFLDLLTPEQRRQQLEMLMEVCDRELIRLNDLRAHHTDTDSALLPWLDHEIDEVKARRDWFLKLWEGQ